MKKLLFVIMLFCLNSLKTFPQPTDLKIGEIAPEIRLPDLKGDTIALSKFRGKIVLIDFWATWCIPCVEEQPQLASLYEKYKQSKFTNGKEFEIYGVSLDSKKTLWEAGIKKMNITWTQVSDLKFWSSPAAQSYNIQELPFNVLIDGDGIILAENVHGEELEQAISRLLSEN